MLLQAEGITCASCAEDMEKILLAQHGIIEASVNFSDERIRVKYNPLLRDRKDIFFSVRRLGYKLRILDEK